MKVLAYLIIKLFEFVWRYMLVLSLVYLLILNLFFEKAFYGICGIVGMVFLAIAIFRLIVKAGSQFGGRL